jgi:hypothetical protein
MGAAATAACFVTTRPRVEWVLSGVRAVRKRLLWVDGILCLGRDEGKN